MKTTETDTLEEVVFDGIRLLESLTRHYGSEKGIEVWEKLGEALGQEVKGQVFFAMLTGESSNRVRIDRGTCTQPVAAIKAIRAGTGYGLKEAKDAWDLTAIKTVVLDNVSRDNRRTLVNELRSLGMVVH